MDPYKHSFWSLSEMKQPVNQWICIAFLGVWCFWIVLYYAVNKAEYIGQNYYNYVNFSNQELRHHSQVTAGDQYPLQ